MRFCAMVYFTKSVFFGQKKPPRGVVSAGYDHPAQALSCPANTVLFQTGQNSLALLVVERY